MADGDDSDEFTTVVEDLLGPEWVHEERVDQIAELVRRYGDPHAFHDRVCEILDEADEDPSRE